MYLKSLSILSHSLYQIQIHLQPYGRWHYNYFHHIYSLFTLKKNFQIFFRIHNEWLYWYWLILPHGYLSTDSNIIYTYLASRISNISVMYTHKHYSKQRSSSLIHSTFECHHVSKTRCKQMRQIICNDKMISSDH